MKWIHEQQQISDVQMDKVYTVPFKVMIHTKAKELQYKTIIEYLATNSFWRKIGLTENEQCTFCEEKTEDLHYFFYDYTLL